MSEKRCEGCECSDELEYHSCPYQREINENESEDYCNCCNECTNQCAEDI